MFKRMFVSLCCVFAFGNLDSTCINKRMTAVNDFARLCIKDVCVWPCRNDELIQACENMDSCHVS